MPVAATDLLLENGGDIDAALMPQLDKVQLSHYLSTKLAQGYAQAAAVTPPLSSALQDAYAAAWAYYELHLAVWRRLSASPATVAVEGEASRTTLASQIQAFKDLADAYLARAQSLLPLPANESSATTVQPAIRNRFRY